MSKFFLLASSFCCLGKTLVNNKQKKGRINQESQKGLYRNDSVGIIEYSNPKIEKFNYDIMIWAVNKLNISYLKNLNLLNEQ